MSSNFDFDPETCKLVPKDLLRDEGKVRNREEYCTERLAELDFDPGQSRVVPETSRKKLSRGNRTGELSFNDGEEFEFDGASSRLVMKSQSRNLEKFMEHPDSAETMVFDPVTGKVMVRQRSNVRTRQGERKVMLDMNRQGPGGFFTSLQILMN